MLTQATLTCISLLRAISVNGNGYSDDSPFESESAGLIDKLVSGGLVRLLPGRAPGSICSYELTRPLYRISLLELLEATGEHLNCNHPTREEFYGRFGKAAQKLGVVNHMTRLYLNDISLVEL